MKLIDINSSEPGTWIDNALRFMEDNYVGSGLSPKILNKLKDLHSKGKIVVKDLGPDKLGGYNHLTGRLSLNSSKFAFLRRDFKKQLEAIGEVGDPRRKELIKDQHARAILELSGTLIHEGQHASKYIWDEGTDETAAFTIEQLWYRHLHGLDSKYTNDIVNLSQDAESDTKSPTYEGLNVHAPSFVKHKQ